MLVAQKGRYSDSYKSLVESLAAGRIGTFYILHGDERYLLERSLGEIRKCLCPDGLGGFNYKRFGGGSVLVDDLEDAINTYPTFAERTLVEVHDFDIFKSEQKNRISEILSDLPDYVCVVLIYDTVPYKPDGRQKLDKEILQRAEVIEFTIQEQDNLVKWIKRHFSDTKKLISTSDAEYLVLITGGYMSTLHSEVGKVAAYAQGEKVTRADIDAVVTPVLDTVAYKLTDALIRREHKNAMRILDELFQMRESPHKLIYSISLKMRQLLAARICIESGLSKNALIDMCGIRYEFQARALMDSARKTTIRNCCDAVLQCAQTAFDLNSAPEPEARMIELIAKLALHGVKDGC